MPDLPPDLLMPRQHIKICGLSEPVTLDAALNAGADMIGLVFFEQSPRHVSLDAAAALAARVKARGAQVVALTVNADDALLAAIADAAAPDLHQLHGAESPARAADVATRFGPVMKAIGVKTAADIARGLDYTQAGARILFDAPPTRDLPGGNGQAFDWRALADAPVPFMLSGGLTPANAAEAMRVPGATGIDVSSGVETGRGVKDAGLIEEFIRAARAA